MELLGAAMYSLGAACRLTCLPVPISVCYTYIVKQSCMSVGAERLNPYRSGEDAMLLPLVSISDGS
jgi:hypothetical protein